MGQIQRTNLVVNLNNDKTRHLKKKNSNNKSKIEWVWEKALFAISTEYLHRQIPRVEDHSYFSFEKNCLRCKLKKKVSNREWDRDKITTYTSSATYWCGVHSLKHKYSNTHTEDHQWRLSTEQLWTRASNDGVKRQLNIFIKYYDAARWTERVDRQSFFLKTVGNLFCSW